MATLQKANFHNVITGTDIPVMFNPAQVVVNKTVPWNPQPKPGAEQPKQQFTSGQARKISMDLEFDTSGLPGEGPDAGNVKDFVDPLASLANKVGDKKEASPPLVRFSWGAKGALEFTCVVDKMNVTYTRFNADGVPTRAKVSVGLMEVSEADYIELTTPPPETKIVEPNAGEPLNTEEGWQERLEGNDQAMQDGKPNQASGEGMLV